MPQPTLQCAGADCIVEGAILLFRLKGERLSAAKKHSNNK